MPWRRRWRWRPRRRRYYRRWGFRAPFRRRYYYRRVRKPKRKLKRIHIDQWQPSTIRLCKIKGLIPLFLCNTYRLGNNLPIYNQSIVPEMLPGGGGFSIYQFTLENLYTMHTYVRNWWTKSNRELPFIRYLKCKIKLYQSDDVDYAFRYQRTQPMTTGQLSYPTTQPGVLMMLNNTIIVPSKRTKRLRKGYKKITIQPPEMLSNKWFFQANIAKYPLLITYCTACSLDHYYIGTDKMSNNCTVPVLNTNMFQNRQFGTNPYYVRTLGTTHVWLWATDDILTSETQQPKPSTLILLANTKKYTEGTTFEIAKRRGTTWQNYRQHIDQYAGNPFHTIYLNELDQHHLTLLQKTAATAQECLPENESGPCTNFTIVHNPLIYRTRYNPNLDTGHTNKTFLLQNFKPSNGWDPPTDTKLILEGFPLWINWWGYLDFQKQQHRLPNIDTSTILVTNTEMLKGTENTLPAYVPLSDDFILGKSPFENSVNPVDENRWYPQVQYQETAINELLRTGPGVAKFNGKKTVEAKAEYIFYCKFGGSPAPMVNIKDPTEQPNFTIPDKLIQTNSLQDPTTPPEFYLYNFDQRRGFLTKSATERIIKDWTFTKPLFTDGTTTPGPPQILQTPQTSENETSDSEKEEETLLNKLLKQRKRQQKLKQRIRQLLEQQSTTKL
nr:MAG: ORF1 [TTV-like mini virus]